MPNSTLKTCSVPFPGKVLLAEGRLVQAFCSQENTILIIIIIIVIVVIVIVIIIIIVILIIFEAAACMRMLRCNERGAGPPHA